MFFSGSLQEGIALAVQEKKAVVCFVYDDSETSSIWEHEFLTGDERLTNLLETRSVLLRIAKDSPEAGFLASVCPVSQCPTVVVIRDGMLREYIVSGVLKNDFCARMTAVLEDEKSQVQAAAPPTVPNIFSAQVPRPEPVTTGSPPTAAAAPSPGGQEQPGQDAVKNTPMDKGKKPVYQVDPGNSKDTTEQTLLEQEKVQKRNIAVNKADERSHKETKERNKLTGPPKAEKESPASRPTPTQGPPTQYRLQVRLFDGSSVRSTFFPADTIRKDVRPWLDSEMEEKRPFNLKRILTPLPNKTLTIAEEDQTLRELISTGSTATFVMVPIKTYTEAYSDAGSLPVRAVSWIFGLASSVIGTATGYVGSLLGYGQPGPAESQSEPSQPTEPQSPTNESQRRPRAWGANIRTLRDQGEQDRSQFYNGNQLNFEPRRDDQ
ncbi:hypothetical protein BJX61DRAFT_490655 [Aspergillus egyptiacus]|nr:hypothetical protein BJX61DRAFT_490655 [Aspergillus egyptiacus]